MKVYLIEVTSHHPNGKDHSEYLNWVFSDVKKAEKKRNELKKEFPYSKTFPTFFEFKIEETELL